MDWYVKIPSIQLKSWAPSVTWDKLFSLWQHAGIAGIIFPVSLSDQLDGFTDQLQTLIQLAKKYRLKPWLIIQVFNNSVYYHRYPHARPKHRFDEQLSFPNWFTPICPTEENYYSFFEKTTGRILDKLPVQTLLLGHLRFPYFWEEWGNIIEDGEWPPFCYCDRCCQKFQEDMQIEFEEATQQQWQGWQCSVLTNWANKIQQFVQNLRPQLRLGVQIVPLISEKKKELRPAWIGQDIADLQKHVDFFSPLVYENLLGWENDDVMSFLVEYLSASRLPIMPSFQVSSVKWDKKKEESRLTSLIQRMQPLGIREATLFHAGNLLSEKSIRFFLG